MNLLTFVGVIAGAILVPSLAIVSLHVGPAARIVYFEYLPIEELAIACAGGVLGASLAVDIARRLQRVPPGNLWRRWQRLQWIGLALLGAWVALSQLRAFPAAASAAEREVWARARLPMYGALARVVGSVPEVQRDVGSISSIAPTADTQHRAAREMNGDDMHFSLDVIGERGSGVFQVDCTLDDYAIYDWRSARWIFQGREQQIPRPTKRN
jgi:hypothetical protein